MKKIKTLLVSLSIVMMCHYCSFSNNHIGIIGNGNIISKVINIKDISEIKNIANFNIILNGDGKQDEIKIETDENIMKYVKYEVNNGKIIFSLEFSSEKDSIRSTKANIYINSNKITLIENGGVGDILIENIKHFNNMTIRNTGVSDINTQNIEGDTLSIYNSGVSDSNLKGTLKILKIYHSGVGKINALEIPVNIAIIENNGNGNVSVNAVQEIYLECNGNGSIDYKGNPTIKSQKVGKNGIIKKIEH